MPMSPVATTQCPVCGNDVLRIDDRLYNPAINGALHGCTAPTPDVPEAVGVPMLLDPDTGLLVEMERDA